MSVEYASSSSIAVGTEQDRDSRLLLFLEVPVADNVQDSAGQFNVICSFGQTVVALSDSGDNAVYYTRFRHPTVVDIRPAEAFISEVGEVSFCSTRGTM